MKQKICKLFFTLIAVVLCTAAFSVTALASGDDWCEYGDYGTPDAEVSEAVTETPEPSEEPVTDSAGTAEDVTQPAPDTSANGSIIISDTSTEGSNVTGTPLTPSGNLNLVDDVQQTTNVSTTADTENSAKSGSDELEEKQFITVQSRNGNYFYIVIDRRGNTENVYFLNQVDEADLMALIENDEPEAETPVCSCTDKCVAGNINLSCPVCQTTMSECTGKEAEPEPSPEPDVEPEKEEPKNGGSGILPVVLLLLLGGGGALYYFKFRKPKTDTKGTVDLDDYDFGEDDDENYEFEKDEQSEEE